MIFRSLFFIFVYLPWMIVFVPTQWVWSSLRLPGWHFIPRWFHTLGTIFLGLKVTVMGKPSQGRPTLIVSNHISWTDIVAIGSVANVTFVAKQEIKKWFFVGFMASLQRSVFVDRNRRTDAKRTTTEMANIMTVLLFAEGQSDVGTHPAVPLGACRRRPAGDGRGRRQGRDDPAADDRLYEAAGPACRPH